MITWKQRLGISLGVIGVVLSLSLSIWVSVNTFFHPLLPYSSYPGDNVIALTYLAAFALVALLFIGKKFRWLVVLPWLTAALIILITLANAQIRISMFLLAWILIVSWFVGEFLFSRIIGAQYVAKGERAVLAIALGWGAITVGALILGIAGLYQSWLLYALFIVITVGGIWRQYRAFIHNSKLPGFRSLQAADSTGYLDVRRPKFYRFVDKARFLVRRKFKGLNDLFKERFNNDVKTPIAHLHNLGFNIMLIMAAGSFLWALAPAVRYDSLSYHLAVPMRYLAAGGMIEIPESIQTYWAHYGEMLYEIALLLGDQPLTSLINFCAGILITIQIYFLGKHLKNETVGILAALIFCSLPIIGIEAATTYIDILIAFFIAAAFQAAMFWHREKNDRWLIIVGIFSGLAIGTKITAFWMLLPFFLLLIIYFAITKDGLHITQSKVETNANHRVFLRSLWNQGWWKRVIGLVLPAVVLFSPWLIRDWFWTGNPIFPNYNNIFHSPNWFDQNFFFIKVNTKTLGSFFAFPWLGITDSHRYYHEAPGSVLGALPMLSLPWFYSWGSQLQEKRKSLLLVVVTTFLAIALLFSVAYHARYLLPLYGLLSIFAAVNLETLGQKLFKRKYFLGVALGVLVFIYLFSTRLAFTVRWWEIPERYPTQIWLGGESQEQFIDRILPVYGAFNYLDQQGAFKVLSIGNELRAYTDSQIYGPFFSKEAYLTLHTASSPDELAKDLEAGAYDYILIYLPEQIFRPDVYQASALNKEFFAKYTRLMYIQRQVYLYRFYPQGVDRSKDMGQNLLQNPGFEIDDAADDWMLMGASYHIDSVDPYQGRNALKLPGPGASAYQDVSVLPGEIYTVAYWAKSISDQQTIQRYIQWLDADGQPIGKSANWKEMAAGWNQYQLSATAPDDAVIARVFVSLVNEGGTWFDNICFVQGDFCP